MPAISLSLSLYEQKGKRGTKDFTMKNGNRQEISCGRQEIVHRILLYSPKVYLLYKTSLNLLHCEYRKICKYIYIYIHILSLILPLLDFMPGIRENLWTCQSTVLVQR